MELLPKAERDRGVRDGGVAVLVELESWNTTLLCYTVCVCVCVCVLVPLCKPRTFFFGRSAVEVVDAESSETLVNLISKCTSKYTYKRKYFHFRHSFSFKTRILVFWVLFCLLRVL